MQNIALFTFFFTIIRKFTLKRPGAKACLHLSFSSDSGSFHTGNYTFSFSLCVNPRQSRFS